MTAKVKKMINFLQKAWRILFIEYRIPWTVKEYLIRLQRGISNRIIIAMAGRAISRRPSIGINYKDNVILQKKPYIKIPKIIHQTWKTNKVPDFLEFCCNSWKAINPEWQYKLWTHNEMEKWIKENYPQLYSIYINYPHAVQRADMFRWLVLYKMGGLYVDLDFECIRPLNYFFSHYVKHGDFIIGLEPSAHAKYFHKINRVICNAFIAAIPNHPMCANIISELEKRSSGDPKTIVYSTGPLVSTHCINDNDKDIDIIDSKILYPIVDIMQPALPIIDRFRDAWRLRKKAFFYETCAVHYWWHCYHPANPNILESLKNLQMNKAFFKNLLKKLGVGKFIKWLEELIMKLKINLPYLILAVTRKPAINIQGAFAMIREKKPFALARYCDGAYFLMAKIVVHVKPDHWVIPSGGETRLGKALLETLRNPLDGLYYGLPIRYSYECTPDRIKGFLLFYRKNTKQKKKYIASTTIFVNINYQVFLESLRTVNPEVVLFANENTNIKDFPWKVKEYYPISTNCVKFFEEHGADLVADVRKLAKKYSNTLFVVCAGPMGDIIVYEGWKENNTNSYVDFGSAFDEFLFGKKTRPYQDPNNFYSTLKEQEFYAEPLL